MQCTARRQNPEDPSWISSNLISLNAYRVFHKDMKAERPVSVYYCQQILFVRRVMSRQSTIEQPRALSLTEELEKLEQSITLTLQGNYLNAHGTTSSDESRNRPQFQQSPSDRNIEYTAHSGAVWKSFTRCMGRLKGWYKSFNQYDPGLSIIAVLETVLRVECQCLPFWL